MLIGSDSLQFCSVQFMCLLDSISLKHFILMEEVNGSMKEEVKEFVFDSTNFELIAQGAEGVVLINEVYSLEII